MTKYLGVLLALMSSAAWANDCKPVTDAMAKTAIAPNHAVIVSRTLGTYETVHIENALYDIFQGKWRRLPYDDAAEALRLGSAYQNADCKLRGAEAFNGQPIRHYAVTEHLRNDKVFNEFWISEATGLILKSYTKFSRDELTTTYDYRDIKAPM
jgi:hypothetical protein